MSKTKRCPACYRELPVLAARCKYCGFKFRLANQPGAEDDSPVRSSTLPPAPPGRPSTPPPPVPRRASVPPKSPKGQNRTLMMQNFGPAGGDASAKTSKADKKSLTHEFGTASPAGKPVGMGRPAAPTAGRAGSTLPPSPPSRPPSAPIHAHGSDSATVDSSGEWIPSTAELGDDTNLIDLNADEVEEIHDETGAEQASVDKVEEHETILLKSMDFALKYIIQDETLDGFEERGWPAALVKILGKLRWVHALGGGVLLVGLMVFIIVMAINGDEIEPPTVAREPAEEPTTAPATTPSAERDPAPPKPAAESKAEVTAAKDKVPAASRPEVPIPEPGRTCRALGNYPEFPWKELLDVAINKAGGKGVCDLLGASPASLAESFAGKVQVGPGGYDLLPGGGLLEVFPVQKPSRRGPSMEYLFIGDKLFEIRFNYWDSAGELDPDLFLDIFEKAPDQPADHLGRKSESLIDGDLIIELFEQKWYGRSLRSLVFASRTIRGTIENGRKQREEAEKLLAEGETQLAARKYKGAQEKFGQAFEKQPGFGLALVRKAFALARTEDFKQVEATAGKVLEISREPRVRAEAFGLVALAALYNNDKEMAISQFKAAIAADPANALFATSRVELETGKYEMARVALTAARMECLSKRRISGTDRGLLARGNFPDFGTYFKVLRASKNSAQFEERKRAYMKYECR